jgi:hypothetical protein
MALQVWHGDLYRVSPFQAYRTSTSCWPYDLEFFMFAVMNTFVTDISASTGRNDFIFDKQYKSPCQRHLSNIKWFLPVEAEISVTKVWTDGQTDGRTDGQTRWLQYSPLSMSGGIITEVKPKKIIYNLQNCELVTYWELWNV